MTICTTVSIFMHNLQVYSIVYQYRALLLVVITLVYFVVLLTDNEISFFVFNGVTPSSNNLVRNNLSNFTAAVTVPIPGKNKRLWPADDIMPDESVMEYFKNTLLIVMMSPSRYHLVREVRKHYIKFFRHIFFCGPNASTQYGIRIRGYFIASGHQQYRAVNRILREDYMREDEGSRSGKVRGQLKRGLGSAKDDTSSTYNITDIYYEDDSETMNPTHSTPTKDMVDGMLYVSDDTILQPWALAAKGMDKRIPWASQMGIGNSLIFSRWATVPGMAVEFSHPLGKRGEIWINAHKYFRNAKKAVSDAGDDFRNRLALAAQATPTNIYIWSDYRTENSAPSNPRIVTNEKNRYELTNATTSKLQVMKSYVINAKYLKWSVFYTIADTYYVPRSMWGEYCEAADLMAKHWVFGEVAIPTILRSIYPTYEEMDVQYYWKGNDTAATCSRRKWHINTVDGFHRCRHDHEFVHAIFTNHSFRKSILNEKHVGFGLNLQDSSFLVKCTAEDNKKQLSPGICDDSAATKYQCQNTKEGDDINCTDYLCGVSIFI